MEDCLHFDVQNLILIKSFRYINPFPHTHIEGEGKNDQERWGAEKQEHVRRDNEAGEKTHGILGKARQRKVMPVYL